jgi:hypothetical protein
MKTIFQVRFLLIAIGTLIVTLYIEHHFSWRTSVSRSIGGPVEIARSVNDHSILLLRLLRFLVSGLVVPSCIGLLVCAVLRWRHPAYQVATMRPLVLSVLVWWAWGLFNLLVYEQAVGSFSYGEKQVFQWASVLTSAMWVIVAARFSYYQERTPRQLIKKDSNDSGFSNAELSAREPE